MKPERLSGISVLKPTRAYSIREQYCPLEILLSPRLPPSGFNVFGNVSDFHSYPGGGIISKFRLNLVHRKRHLFAIHLFGRNGIVNLALREILRIGSKRVSENERMHFESEGFVNYLRLIL